MFQRPLLFRAACIDGEMHASSGEFLFSPTRGRFGEPPIETNRLQNHPRGGQDLPPLLKDWEVAILSLDPVWRDPSVPKMLPAVLVNQTPTRADQCGDNECPVRPAEIKHQVKFFIAKVF